jgi:predicted PurR-regulated permease PerM
VPVPDSPPSRASQAWPNRDILRATLLVAGVVLALQLLWVARSVFVLAFLGVLFGLTLSAGVTWLERRRVPRTVGTVLLLLVIFGLLVGLGALVAPRIGEQVQELQHQLPSAIGRVEEWIRERLTRITQLLPGRGPQAGGEQDTIRATLSEQVGKLGAGFFAIFSSAVAVLGGLLVITFVAAYIAADPRTYRRGIMHLVPHDARPKAAEVMDATAVTLRRWLVAQLIGMLVIGSITTVVLLLLDVKAALALGIIAGVFEFIPYFGPILSAVPAVAMGFLDGPEKAIWVVLAYLAIQQIEGNLVTPFLMKEGLDLPPVVTIVGQATLAVVFGFVGLFIAVPLLGALMVPIKLLYVHDVVGDEVHLPGSD